MEEMFALLQDVTISVPLSYKQSISQYNIVFSVRDGYILITIVVE